ncbi:hypothetical protein LJC24_01495 [Desulfococcaceae bacterium OttesenSCG-928-F15]|nr:hypothetical protein [Desulfococcaceae bacterium OttesenSCG-928-F15]
MPSASPLHTVLLNHNRQSGKTTIARNLAAAGALWKSPTLLVTCEKPNPVYLEIFNENKDSTLAEDIEISSFFYLFIHPENQGLHMDFPTLQKKVKTALTFLPEVRQVVWDAPSTLSSLTRAMLRYAHIILVPFKIEEESFERLGQTLGILERIKKNENPNLLYWGMLPIFIKPDQRFSKIFSGLALPLFKTQIIPVPIPEEPAFIRAEEKGRPIFSEDILSTGAIALRNLSDWIGKSFSFKNEQKRLT